MRYALLLLAAACAHRPPPPPPSPGDVALGLDLASVALHLSAVQVDDPPACVALSVLGAAAQRGAALTRSGGRDAPAQRVDVSGCGLGLSPVAVPDGLDEVIAGSVAALRAVVLSRLDGAPCEARAVADAVLADVRAVGALALDELPAPDGVVLLPAFRVAECGE